MNGFILVDKPRGFTSHDVVAKLRGILRQRRIGHSGTLDPMATGLLVVFIGRATRAVQFAEKHEKEYIAGLKTGLVTDTQDITGNVLSETGKTAEKDELLRILPEFLGEQNQLPPMYSAVKVGGKKLYELARKGLEVERKPRQITIKTLELIGREGEDFILRVVCSKGTYIRSLCHDIGQRLGTGAVLSSLRRTAAGGLMVENAHDLEEISALAEAGRIEEILQPVDSLFQAHPAVILTAAQTKRCLTGNSFPFSGEEGTVRVYDEAGGFLMLGLVKNGLMHTIKSFFEVDAAGN